VHLVGFKPAWIAVTVRKEEDVDVVIPCDIRAPDGKEKESKADNEEQRDEGRPQSPLWHYEEVKGGRERAGDACRHTQRGLAD